MDKKYIQIFGVQRTSTTYVGNLITVNSDNVFLSTDNKHAEPKDFNYLKDSLTTRLANFKKNKKLQKNKVMLDGLAKRIRDTFELNKKMHPLIVIKNPYSWYQSILRWSVLYDRKFDIKRWYNRYNAMYEHWKELLENPYKPFGPGRVVCYEKLLKNPAELLHYVRDKYGVILRDKITIPDRMASAKNVPKELKFFTEERKKFYLQKGNFGLSNELIEEITELVDWELMKFYGYKPK